MSLLNSHYIINNYQNPFNSHLSNNSLKMIGIIQFFKILHLQLPEDWLDDGRCQVCGYSERSSPKLCICNEYLKQVPRIGPIAPTRGTLPKKKVRQSFHVRYLRHRLNLHSLVRFTEAFISLQTKSFMCSVFFCLL